MSLRSRSSNDGTTRTASLIPTMSSVRDTAACGLHQERQAAVPSLPGELEEDMERGAVKEDDTVDVDHEERLGRRCCVEALLELACVREIELARERRDDDSFGGVM